MPFLGLSNYETYLFKAMFLMQFHFALRIGEITSSPHNLMFNHVEITADKIIVQFQSYKHCDPEENTPHQTLRSFDSHCPVTALAEYINLRGSADGPLFKINNQGVHRHIYNSKLKIVLQAVGEDPLKYSSHSFRIGATNYWANKGLSEFQIKRLGRWKSAALYKYLRGPIDHSLV